MISESFQFLTDRFGAPKPTRSLDLDDEALLRQQLPGSLVDFWKVYGLGQWLEGGFQFCKPDDFASLLPAIFNGDKDFKPEDCFIYGYSAFGGLFIWNKKHYNIEIDLVYTQTHN